jgi:hypothetical protein
MVVSLAVNARNDRGAGAGCREQPPTTRAAHTTVTIVRMVSMGGFLLTPSWGEETTGGKGETAASLTSHALRRD